jgi:hypothetical protein
MVRQTLSHRPTEDQRERWIGARGCDTCVAQAYMDAPRGLRDARNAQLNVRAAWLGVNTSTARLGNTEIMKKFTTLNH